MMLGGADEAFARIAASLAQAKTVAVLVGFVLLAGALLARFEARKKKE